VKGFWRVCCGTCLINDHALVVRETCSHCAQSVAANHRALGHEVTITPPQPEPRWERSKSTQQLLGKGW
jgi:hypothetical protein